MYQKFMSRAIELAKRGRGFVSPNPLVGAVIVKNDKIIGEGWHMKYGESHAEVNAIKSAKESIVGSDVYVTLEPCSHYGHTPPCAKALIENGVKRVFIGSYDPNPIVAGNGIKMLKEANIEVITDVMKDECDKLNSIFFKYITTGMPYVTLKTAMTLDGKIASYCGNSKWISNEKSRHIVHKLRHYNKAIMVGINTVLKDNPMLNCRLSECCIDPIRIIVDSTLKIPLNSNVLTDSNAIILTTDRADANKISKITDMGMEVITTPYSNGVDLNYAIKCLGEKSIDSILLEGGGTLNYSMLINGLVDKVMTFISPKIIGGEYAKTPVEGKGIEFMPDAIKLKNLEIKSIDDDILVCGEVIKCLQA